MGGLHHDMTEEGQKETQALVLNTQARVLHTHSLIDCILHAQGYLSVGLGGSHPFDECTWQRGVVLCTSGSRGALHTNTLSETLEIETKLWYIQLLSITVDLKINTHIVIT
jgi:hypothetical protein